MNTQITVFTNSEFGSLRTFVDDNANIWFVGNEIAIALGYSNYRNAIAKHVDDDDKLRTQIEYAGQKREVMLINESGLYALILSSKLPKAKEFKHWVTSEVLPSVRKDGGYMTAKPDDTDESIMARAILIAQSTIQRLKREKETLEMKAGYLDDFLRCENCYTTTTIAKELGMTARELNTYLCNRKIQYRQSGQYNLYAEYARMDLARYRTPENTDKEGNIKIFHTYMVWTEKGRAFIHQYIRQHPTVSTPSPPPNQLNLFS